MTQYRFEFLDADRKPIAKCHYQIMQYDSTLRKDVADENGRAAFDSELIAGKKIWVRFCQADRHASGNAARRGIAARRADPARTRPRLRKKRAGQNLQNRRLPHHPPRQTRRQRHVRHGKADQMAGQQIHADMGMGRRRSAHHDEIRRGPCGRDELQRSRNPRHLGHRAADVEAG